MSPRKPIEQDMVDGLRDLREQFMKLSKSILTLAESIDQRFDAIEEENHSYRKKRIEEEAEQAKMLYEKKAAAVADQKNDSTTQKFKAIAADAVKSEMSAKQIDWGEIWRKNLVPAGATFVFLAVLGAALYALVPAVIQILQKAFGG
ncbi:MAG: hypothetical protein L0287_13050 [Anaerolineae bacterium]|nr:hypothetical protein [Anaerolineae bacterium]